MKLTSVEGLVSLALVALGSLVGWAVSWGALNQRVKALEAETARLREWRHSLPTLELAARLHAAVERQEPSEEKP